MFIRKKLHLYIFISFFSNMQEITYQTFNAWMKKVKIQLMENISGFLNILKNIMLMKIGNY